MRKGVCALGALVSISVLIVATAAAAGLSTSFEEFAFGTNGAAITVPGVTFGSFCTVYPGFFSWNGPEDQKTLFNSPGGGGSPPLAPILPGDCVMTFDRPQSSISFDWATCDVPLIVTAFLGGVEVFEQVYVGTNPPGFDYPEGSVAFSAMFDQVALSAECLAIDHLRTTQGEEPVVEGALPGCDVQIPIPSTAVGAKFVADAQVYWEPGALTYPLVTLEAGKTVRALGVDATGQYTKILYVCDFLWVRSETLGPNPEAPWYGAPLPTGVVD